MIPSQQEHICVFLFHLAKTFNHLGAVWSCWRSFPSTLAVVFKSLFRKQLFILEIILLLLVFLSWKRTYIKCIHYKRTDSHSYRVCVFNGHAFEFCVCVGVWLTGQPPGSCWCKEGFGGLRCDRWETHTHMNWRHQIVTAEQNCSAVVV